MPGYQQQLHDLRQRLLLMAGRVEQILAQSIQALLERDPEAARRTIAADRDINRDELETDELCETILAEHRLEIQDLRFVTSALKMVTDLERIGDLAVNICERVIDLSSMPLLKPYVDIPRMAEIVQSMIHDAVDAFVDRDDAKARDVIERDNQVDELYDHVFGDILELMRRDEANVHPGIHVLSVAKWLERMADHSTNLAENVVYLVAGQNLRHAGKLAERR